MSTTGKIRLSGPAQAQAKGEAMSAVDELIAAGRDPLDAIIVSGDVAAELRERELDRRLRTWIERMPDDLRLHLRKRIAEKLEQT